MSDEEKKFRKEIAQHANHAARRALFKYAQKKKQHGDSPESVMDVVHFTNAFFPAGKEYYPEKD